MSNICYLLKNSVGIVLTVFTGFQLVCMTVAVNKMGGHGLISKNASSLPCAMQEHTIKK